MPNQVWQWQPDECDSVKVSTRYCQRGFCVSVCMNKRLISVEMMKLVNGGIRAEVGMILMNKWYGKKDTSDLLALSSWWWVHWHFPIHHWGLKPWVALQLLWIVAHKLLARSLESIKKMYNGPPADFKYSDQETIKGPKRDKKVSLPT